VTSSRGDAGRFALGLFSRWPVRPPARVDATTWRDALLLAPVIGAGIGAVVALVAWLVAEVSGTALLGGVAGVAVAAAATRALHLDGLADTVDGLGSSRPPDEALEVMRRGDVGPFGVVAVVLVLLAQCAAIAALLIDGSVWIVVVAFAASRLLAGWCCRRDLPAARTDGLGAQAAGSVPLLRWSATAATLLVVASGAGALLDGAAGAAASVAAIGAAWAAGAWLCRRAVTRIGGTTGDVIGACIETATTGALVAAVVVLG
jgi:adenosylcobinamide-GDP ribazoletransferase